MLLERASQLAIRIKQYHRANDLAREAEAFATRANQLAGPVENLRQLKVLAAEFAANDIDVPFDPVPGMGIAKRAQELLDAFTADPKSLTAGDESFRHQFLPGVRNLGQQLKTALEEGWRRRVDLELEPLPQDVLIALETIASYRDQIQAIRRCDEEARRSRLMLPEEGTIVNRLAALGKLIKVKEQAWQALKGSELPDEIIDFLKQAGTRGFPLASLTPSITHWLTDRGLLSSFRIRSV